MAATNDREVLAWFASESDAELAVKELMDAGIARDAVRLMPGEESDQPEGPATPDPRNIRPVRPTAFVGSVAVPLPANGLGVEAEPPQQGWLVSVQTAAANHEKVADLLTRRGTIERDEIGDQAGTAR